MKIDLGQILVKIQKGIEAVAFSAFLTEVYVTKRKLRHARYQKRRNANN
jgi:hypothetical protein